MKSEVLSKEGCLVKFKAEVDEQKMSELEKPIIEDLVKNSNLKGFRKGKAPEAMVVKIYNDQIKNKVLSNNVYAFMGEIFKEHKIFPVGEPEISEINYDVKSSFSLQGEIETYPEFEVNDYTGLELKRVSSEVTDQDVEAYIKNIADYSAPFSTIQDREVKDGDFAVVDFEVFDGEQSIEKKDGSWIKISSDQDDLFLQEMVKALLNMKICDEKDIELTLPENYTIKEMSGKKAKVHVVLKEIKVKEVPVIDDEYVKKLDPSLDSLDAYKEKIKGFLKEQKESESKMNLKDQIAKSLIAENRFDLPEKLLKKQTDEMFKYQLNQMTGQGVDEDTLQKMHDDIFKSASDTATQQLKLEFIYGKILDKEKLEVKAEDMQEALGKEAPKMGMTKEAFAKFLKNNKRESYFKQNLLVEKVYQFIIDKSKITEEINNK